MRHTRWYYAVIVAALATAGLLAFHPNARAALNSNSKEESFQFGGLRSFEIVPLETVSETSSNASIGDLTAMEIRISCW